MDLRLATKICGSKNFPYPPKTIYNWRRRKTFPGLIHKTGGHIAVDMDEWKKILKNPDMEIEKELGKFELKEETKPEQKEIEFNNEKDICPFLTIAMQKPTACKKDKCAVYTLFESKNRSFNACSFTALSFIPEIASKRLRVMNNNHGHKIYNKEYNSETEKTVQPKI